MYIWVHFGHNYVIQLILLSECFNGFKHSSRAFHFIAIVTMNEKKHINELN